MVSGYTLTTFPNAIHAATKATANKQQMTMQSMFKRGTGTAH